MSIQKLNPLTTNIPSIETRQLICRLNQLTGFYIIGTLVVKRLRENGVLIHILVI